MPKRQRDQDYLEWIHTLPCLCCGRGPVEAHHFGPRGLGQKVSDRSTIPLCPEHHRNGKDAVHKLGPRKFQELWEVDLPALIERLNWAYDAQSGRQSTPDFP